MGLRRADDGSRTHALSVAHSDATNYITTANFQANNEGRTRTESLEDSRATATPYSQLKMVMF